MMTITYFSHFTQIRTQTHGDFSGGGGGEKTILSRSYITFARARKKTKKKKPSTANLLYPAQFYV